MIIVFAWLYNFCFSCISNSFYLYLYKFYNIFVQMLSHTKTTLSSLSPQRQPLRALSPPLLYGSLLSSWMTRDCPETFLSVLLAGVSILVITYSYLFGFYFLFLKLILQHLPKKRCMGCTFLSLCMYRNFLKKFSYHID